MAKENSREQKMKYIFGNNPQIKELHVTSDDQAFTLERDAANHAANLEDKEIALVKRSEYVAASKTEVVVDQEAEREAAIARHLELFDKEPAKTAKLETILAKIEAEENRLQEEADKEPESDSEGDE